MNAFMNHLSPHNIPSSFFLLVHTNISFIQIFFPLSVSDILLYQTRPLYCNLAHCTVTTSTVLYTLYHYTHQLMTTSILHKPRPQYSTVISIHVRYTYLCAQYANSWVAAWVAVSQGCNFMPSRLFFG